ncbi:DUF6156 family protein [Methylibium sp.]|uniref:DUF6156 family protein n=1 Tax=Methylibium sp. TaxID=2067992 RepID=UPI003D0D9433
MLTTTDAPHLRYFLTYRGMTLPLCLVEELAPEALRNRNTYFRAAYDAAGRMVWLEKLVYAEVELRHDYRYGSDGTLCGATISTPDEEPQQLQIGSAANEH